MTSLALAVALSVTGGGQRFARQCVTAAGYQAQQVSYQTVAYAPVQTYAVPYAVNTQFVAVEQYADPYYAQLVGSAARGQNAAASVQNLTNQIATLSASVAQLTATVAAGNSTATPPVPPPVVQPPLPPDQNPQPPVNPNPLPPTVNPQPNVPPPPRPAGVPPANVSAILAKRCASCHTAGKLKKDAIALFREDGVTTLVYSPAEMVLIDQEIYSGDMPRNAAPLNSEEYSAIRAWINDSKDQITATLKDQIKASK